MNDNVQLNDVLHHPFAETHRFQIGDIEVIALADGYTTLPLALMSNFDAQRAQELTRASYKTYNEQMLNAAVNGFIIKTANKTIAVDTGAPFAFSPNLGAWQQSLKQAGIDPQSIDTLFLTHAHADHVAGMSTEDGKRYFPNAQLITSDVEWQFAHDEAMVSQMPEDFRPMAYFAQKQLAPYAQHRQMVTMASETEIAPGVMAVPMPGHTPGHMGLRITSDNKSLMIWGDLVHAPSYQFAEPSWGIVFDADLEEAHKTRAKLLAQLSAERTLVAGMHLDFPGLGYVERAKVNYRYITAPRDYGA